MATPTSVYQSSLGTVNVIGRPTLVLGAVNANGHPLKVICSTGRKVPDVMLDKPATPSDLVAVPLVDGSILLFPFSIFDGVATRATVYAPLSKCTLVDALPPKAKANNVVDADGFSF